jgi:hypothetical protein
MVSYMPHRFAFVLLTLVFLVAVPATASGQAPLDEPANARAFADVGVAMAEPLRAAAAPLDATVSDPPPCLTGTRLARRLDRAPKRRGDAFSALYSAQLVGTFTRAAAPIIADAVAAMHAIQTADPGLRGGRTAWRRIQRAYATISALPVVDICAEAHTFVRSGYHRTPVIRQAQRTMQEVEHTGGIDRRLARAVKRLEALGVPAADADLFDGPFSD